MQPRAKKLVFLCTVFFCWQGNFASANSPDFQLGRLQLNPKLDLKKVRGNFTKSDFSYLYILGEVEIQITGTKVDDSAAARKKAKVDAASILSLYSPRGNPYKGQVTSVIECQKKHRPQVFSFKLGKGIEIVSLLAGSDTRKAFGTCDPEEISFWSAYFNFYENESGWLVEGRGFLRLLTADEKEIKSASTKLRDIVKNLFTLERSKL
jgi:hypothetical protein